MRHSANRINSLPHILSLKCLKVLELEDGKINYVDNEQVDGSTKLCKLEELSLSNCEGDLDIILNLVGPTLVKVNLGFTEIENMEINLLVSRAPNVTELNLRQCTRIGHHGFVNLFRTLGSKLQELNLQEDR